MCEAPSLKSFKHWRIVKNDFPYDLIAKVHNMLMPKRHVKESKLSQKEKQEFAKIKAGYVEKNYDFLVEPASRLKSIPSHFHVHLIVTKY